MSSESHLPLAIPAGSQVRVPDPDGSTDPQPVVELPVAAVLVDTPLAHLNRPFEYSVPVELDDQARPGVRVKVRFAGRDRDGFIVERRRQAEHPGTLAPLRRVVSEEVVLTPEIAALARRVAEYYAGNTSDVLRLAVPPRHARAEKRRVGSGPASQAEVPALVFDPDARDGAAVSAWQDYPAGPAFLRHLAAGRFPAAAWTALPDGGATSGWPLAIAQATAATLAAERGVVIVVPDHRDVVRVGAALDEVLGAGQHVRLTADLGPERRYRAWLRALREEVSVILGTRAAAYAPVRRLGLVIWWDDGDDLHDEPRAPYPHTRQVLRLRAESARAGLLVGGYTRSVAVQGWVEDGWMQPIIAAPETIRSRVPRVTVAGEGHQERDDPAAAAARIPSVAWRAISEGLRRGPVLVQVPRRGYLAGLACARCRHRVRCDACAGPLVVAAPGAAPHCHWCGATEHQVSRCPECGGSQWRSTVVGHRRTAEELGRAFPGVPVRTSAGEHVLAQVPAEPALILATPGAEPIADSGFAAAVLLDGWALLDRAGLDSAQEALRRWMTAAALVRPDPSRRGAAVVLVGVPAHAGLTAVEALIRWDPAWFAAREWQDRSGLDLPPAVSVATFVGEPDVVAAALQELQPLTLEPPNLQPEAGEATVPAGFSITSVTQHSDSAPGSEPKSPPSVLGLVRAPRSAHRVLVGAARAVREGRSARKSAGQLRVRIDPSDLII